LKLTKFHLFVYFSALRLIQAFQFVEKEGLVCPAGWKPGAPAMKADPVGAQEYFKKQN
jgi:alkyl hydroperoxide reductase subunit AhpC